MKVKIYTPKKAKNNATPKPPHVKVLKEGRRGCGFRKAGGIYLCSDDPEIPCALFPLPLAPCSKCGAVIKPFRGYKWIDPKRLMRRSCPRRKAKSRDPACCRLDEFSGKAILMWVGDEFYSTPAEFRRECRMLGLSRRIRCVPKGFQVGHTWLFLAHRFVIHPKAGGTGKAKPGIFTALCPTRMEYVVRGNETDDVLRKKEAAGFTLVRVTMA